MKDVKCKVRRSDTISCNGRELTIVRGDVDRFPIDFVSLFPAHFKPLEKVELEKMGCCDGETTMSLAAISVTRNPERFVLCVVDKHSEKLSKLIGAASQKSYSMRKNGDLVQVLKEDLAVMKETFHIVPTDAGGKPDPQFLDKLAEAQIAADKKHIQDAAREKAKAVAATADLEALKQEKLEAAQKEADNLVAAATASNSDAERNE